LKNNLKKKQLPEANKINYHAIAKLQNSSLKQNVKLPPSKTHLPHTIISTHPYQKLVETTLELTTDTLEIIKNLKNFLINSV